MPELSMEGRLFAGCVVEESVRNFREWSRSIDTPKLPKDLNVFSTCIDELGSLEA